MKRVLKQLGYKRDSSTVIQVLVKTAIESLTIESICEDLRLSHYRG